jgi:hypothetical protein
LIIKKIKNKNKYKKKSSFKERLENIVSINSIPIVLFLVTSRLIIGKIIPIPKVSKINEKNINIRININLIFCFFSKILNKVLMR